MKSLLLDCGREGSSLLILRTYTCPLHIQRQHSPSTTRCRVRPRVSSVTEQQVAQLSPVLQLSASVNSHNHHASYADSQQQLSPRVEHDLSQQPSSHTNNLPLKVQQPLTQQQQQQYFLSQQLCEFEQVINAAIPVNDMEWAKAQPAQHHQQQQQQQQQQRRSKHKQKHGTSKGTKTRQPLLTPELLQQVTDLLAAGSSNEADQLLQGQIEQLRELKQLKSATDELAKAALLRPAVVVALLVQLGTVVTRQQQLRTKALQQQRRQHHVQVAVQVNRDRQNKRHQHRVDVEQQQRQEAARQHAAAEAAARAHITAQHQAIISRFDCRAADQPVVRCGSFRMPTVAAAAAAPLAYYTPSPDSSDIEVAGADCSRTGSMSSVTSAGNATQQQQQRSEAAAVCTVREQISSSKSEDSAARHFSTKPSYGKQQTQQRRWPADGMPKPAKQLLNRLLALVKANIAEYSAEQLSLLHHWLVKLQVSDTRLSQQLQKRATHQLLAARPQTLVPLLWGVAKMQAAAESKTHSLASVPGTSKAGRASQGTSSSSSSSSSKSSQKTRLSADAMTQQLQQTVQQSTPAPAGSSTQVNFPKQQKQPQQQMSRSLLNPPPSNNRAALQQAEQQQSPQSQQQQQQQQQGDNQQTAQPIASAASDPAFVAAWLKASVHHLSSLSSSQLAASVYSLALLKQRPPEVWLEAYFAASRAKMQYSSAQDLSNTLWALGTLQLSPPDSGWWCQFQVATTAVLWKFKGVGIANLIWGAAKLHLQPNPQLSQLLLWQAQRRFSEMDLQLVASLAWGVAELEMKPQLQWLHYMGRRIRWLQGSLTPGLTASLLLSLSSLGYCPKTWMRRFLAAAHPQLPAFSTQDIANTFTALARMRYVPKDDWLFDFLVEARRAIPHCQSPELLSISHALSVLSTNTEYRVHPDFLAALLARARVCAPGFSTENCVRLAQSLVYLKVAPGVGLLSVLAETFSEKASAASASDVAGMLWVLGAFWRGDSECLWLRQHPQLLQQLLTLSQQHLVARVYSPLELKRVIAAMAAMGCNPGRVWLAAHEAAVVSLLNALYSVTLEQVLRGYRALGYQPQQGQLLQQALVVKQQQAQHQQQTVGGDQLVE